MESYPFIRQVRSPISKEMLAPLDPRCRVVQFCSPLSESDFLRLSELMRAHPQVPLRTYGHETVEQFDLEFLKLFPFLRNFQVDVWTLKSLDGLAYLPSNLQFLGLGATKSKVISLRILKRFPDLEELFLEGQTKDFEAVSGLTKLQRLTLRSISLPDLSTLRPLEHLWWLAIKLGGTRNLSLLPEIGRLKYLELWLIRGLSDLQAIADVESLQYLFLQSLKQVRALPSCKRLTALRRVHVEAMSGLRDLAPLREATALEELLVVDARHMDPSDFASLAGHPTLKRATMGLGSDKKNRLVREYLPLLPMQDLKGGFEFR
jgi:hypothetical protein